MSSELTTFSDDVPLSQKSHSSMTNGHVAYRNGNGASARDSSLSDDGDDDDDDVPLAVCSQTFA